MATKSRYDVVIVGARCAGATLATFVAEPGLPSCSWTGTGFRAIRSCRLIRSIRQVWTFSTTRVSATQSARWRRRRILCGCEKTRPSSTSSFRWRAENRRPARLDGLLQDAAASAGVRSLTNGVTSLLRDGSACRRASRRADRSRGEFGRPRVEPTAAFHDRTPGRCRRSTSCTMPRAQCIGGSERSCVLAHGSSLSIRDESQTPRVTFK